MPLLFLDGSYGLSPSTAFLWVMGKRPASPKQQRNGPLAAGLCREAAPRALEMSRATLEQETSGQAVLSKAGKAVSDFGSKE